MVSQVDEKQDRLGTSSVGGRRWVSKRAVWRGALSTIAGGWALRFTW